MQGVDVRGASHRRLFRDRREAGAALAECLHAHRGRGTLVLGIPRGGVVVAAEVARRLDSELDVVVARKLGAPGAPELAIGAVTADGGRFINQDLVRELNVSGDYLARVTAEEMAEARRREARFRGGRSMAPIEGRVVIIVDDGLATGATMRAVVRAVQRHRPSRLVVAVPVGSRDTCAQLKQEVDEVLCLSQPEPFHAVGLYYERFDPTGDEEVEQTLQEWHPRGRPG
jgi:putative phosphoribosyl transferase